MKIKKVEYHNYDVSERLIIDGELYEVVKAIDGCDGCIGNGESCKIQELKLNDVKIVIPCTGLIFKRVEERQIISYTSK